MEAAWACMSWSALWGPVQLQTCGTWQVFAIEIERVDRYDSGIRETWRQDKIATGRSVIVNVRFGHERAALERQYFHNPNVECCTTSLVNRK